MADEESTMSSVASTTTVDSHKRKLKDLELNEGNLDLDSVDNAAQCEENCGAVEFEPKRPRFESNVSQDGHQEEEKEDEMKGKESEHPKDDNGQAVAGQEPVKEQLETITEESASDGNENPEIGSAKELGPKNLEGKEPSQARPREGDVPVPTPEQHPGSDAQIRSRIIEVPTDKLGVLIGKAGDNIRSLQDNSGAKIQMVSDADADLRSATTPLELVGPLHNINKAEKLIKDVIAEADAGGSPSLVARGFSIVQATGIAEQLEIQVPIEKVGFIIGKGAETIRNLQTRSGARIQLIQQNLSNGEQYMEKTVRVIGNKKQIETAREMIKDVMNQHTMEEERQTQGSGVGPIVPQSSSGYSQGSQTSKETSSAQHAACAEQIQMLKAELKELTEVIRRLVPNIQLPPLNAPPS